jgi:hypothetical protein
MTTNQDADPIYQQHLDHPSAQAVSASEEQILRQAVMKLNGNVLGIVLGSIAALGIFVATNWLILRGGEVVGPHLGLLDQFFIGYSVTFVGSLVGALYAFVIGYLSGMLVGWVYNAIVFLRRPRSSGRG